jgi:phosphonate degradation associated HDIG domain protein
MNDVAKLIENIYRTKGDLSYLGEGVSQIEHAWQCGQLAKRNSVSLELQLAAWLHDIGHLLSKEGETPTLKGHNDRHELVGSNFLKHLFPEAVFEPIALHVEAKRYLIATDSSYSEKLSSDSIRSLALQGGPLSIEECQKFLSKPFAQDAIALRRWDDQAKDSECSLLNKEAILNELNDLMVSCS